MTVLIIMVGLMFGLTIIYLLVLRPWHLHWGASDKEINLVLAGDNVVLKPDFNATRGISIPEMPQEIWKWIIQIGSKRTGWYSIDWIDNGGKKSATEILPEYQKIEAGQIIPFTPDRKNGMWVKEFKEPVYILWVD